MSRIRILTIYIWQSEYERGMLAIAKFLIIHQFIRYAEAARHMYKHSKVH